MKITGTIIALGTAVFTKVVFLLASQNNLPQTSENEDCFWGLALCCRAIASFHVFCLRQSWQTSHLGLALRPTATSLVQWRSTVRKRLHKLFWALWACTCRTGSANSFAGRNQAGKMRRCSFASRVLQNKYSTALTRLCFFFYWGLWTNERPGPIVFRWFEVCCAIWARMSQISASQIKAPTDSIFQKYVYTCFMVKMRIDLWSFGLFWFILGWG